MRFIILTQALTSTSRSNSSTAGNHNRLIRPKPDSARPDLKHVLRNSRGQGLIEYLLLVAIMSIATLSIIKVVGQNVAAQYGNVARALQGGSVATQKQQMDKVDDNLTRKRDMATFVSE